MATKLTTVPYSYWCSHLTDIDGVEWRQQDWDARIIVRGLKGEPFNGYLEWSISKKLRKFTSANVGDFIRILLANLGKGVGQEIAGNLTVVPIPGSKMAVGAKGPFRIVEQAEMFAEGIGAQATVVPAIRWVKVRDPSHKTKGWRSPDNYQPLMRLAGKPKGDVLLFDDVLTSGSQMIAAARFMSENGLRVVRCVTVAKASKLQSDKAFKWRTSELEVRRQNSKFEDFS